jgi:hypothetical protein
VIIINMKIDPGPDLNLMIVGLGMKAVDLGTMIIGLGMMIIEVNIIENIIENIIVKVIFL